jgi:hypothetical protein
VQEDFRVDVSVTGKLVPLAWTTPSANSRGVSILLD